MKYFYLLEDLFLKVGNIYNTISCLKFLFVYFIIIDVRKIIYSGG